MSGLVGGSEPPLVKFVNLAGPLRRLAGGGGSSMQSDYGRTSRNWGREGVTILSGRIFFYQ